MLSWSCARSDKSWLAQQECYVGLVPLSQLLKIENLEIGMVWGHVIVRLSAILKLYTKTAVI